MAVCILAVAAIPMLKSFISAFYANSKARERLTAMMVAEDVMESLKGHRYKDIEAQLLDYEKGNTVSFNLFAPGIVQEDTAISVNRILTDDKSLEELRVTMSNLHAKSRADHVYDVSLSINAAMFRSPNTDTVSYNSFPLVGSRKMSAVYDAFFYTDSYRADLEEAIKNIRLIYPDQYDDITREDLSRLFVATVEKGGEIEADDGTKADRIRATVKVKYYLGKFSTTAPIFEKTYPVYDNVDTATSGGKLKNFYLFYYPGYDLRTAEFSGFESSNYIWSPGSRHDTIVFENQEEIPLNFYVVKQVTDIEGNLTAQELGYRPYVVIHEKNSGTMATTVCSNLNVNLADETELTGISAAQNFKVIPDKKMEDPFKGLVGESTDRLFGAFVEVYKKGSAPAFERKNRLAELDSTKID